MFVPNTNSKLFQIKNLKFIVVHSQYTHTQTKIKMETAAFVSFNDLKPNHVDFVPEPIMCSTGNIGVGASSKNGKNTVDVHGKVSGKPTDNSTVTVSGKADSHGNKEVQIDVGVSW